MNLLRNTRDEKKENKSNLRISLLLKNFVTAFVNMMYTRSLQFH